MKGGVDRQPTALQSAQVRAVLPVGHLACLLFCLVMPPLASGWQLAAVAAVSLVIAAHAGWRGVAVLADWRSWALVAALAVPAAVLATRGGAPAGAEPAAREALETGAQIALRVLSMLLGLSAFAASVSVAGLGALMERAGLRGLGFALGVAVNALPTVAEKVSNGYHAIRLRGGFQKRRLEALRLWLVAVVVATLRHADDVVSAAEARAFSADRPRRLPTLASWPDLVVIVLLVGAAVSILLYR